MIVGFSLYDDPFAPPGPLIPWLSSLPWSFGEGIAAAAGVLVLYIAIRFYPTIAAAFFGVLATLVILIAGRLELWPLYAPVGLGALFWWMERGCFPGGDTTKEEPQE